MASSPGSNKCDVLLPGLPLAGKESALASLAWTFIYVSLGGLLLIGVAGSVLMAQHEAP